LPGKPLVAEPVQKSDGSVIQSPYDPQNPALNGFVRGRFNSRRERAAFVSNGLPQTWMGYIVVIAEPTE
jgi:hypothetical protein